MLETLILVGLASIIAGGIAAVSGFGIGSVLTPLLLLWFPAAQSVALVAMPHALASVIRWVRLRRDVDRFTFVQFGIASALGGLMGALLQGRLGGVILTALLGVLLLLAGGSELAQRHLPLPNRSVFRLGGGLLSGAFGGLVGNQGGIRTAALLGFRLNPRQLVATSTASAIIVDLVRVPIYMHRSLSVITSNIPLLLVAAAGATVGTFVGVPVLSRIPVGAYRRIIGAMLVLLGAGLLLTALTRG